MKIVLRQYFWLCVLIVAIVILCALYAYKENRGLQEEDDGLDIVDFPDPDYPNQLYFFRGFGRRKTTRLSNTLKVTEKVSEVSKMPEISEIVNPHPFDYILAEEDFCSADRFEKPFILIMVESAAHNFAQRQEVRETWANFPNTYSMIVPTLFVLGYNHTVQKEVLEESEIFHDIVQEDFIDSYENITYKSVMILKWASYYCWSTVYVLKTDDDMLVNVFSLIEYMKRFYLSGVATENSIVCNVWTDMPVNVDPTYRWNAPKDDKRFAQTYPKYCSGSAYIMSQDLLAPMLNASYYTEFFRLEDVYVTGLVLQKLNPNYVDIKFLYVLAPMLQEQMERLIQDDYAIFGHVTSEERKYAWNVILARHHPGLFTTTIPLNHTLPNSTILQN